MKSRTCPLDKERWDHIDLTGNSPRKKKSWTYPPIPKLEVLGYHLFYWSCVFYSLYRFAGGCYKWRSHLPLTRRDNIFGVYQDQNDAEWNVFFPMIIDLFPFNILHLLLSQCVRKWMPEVLCLFYSVFSFLLLTKAIGVIGGSVCASVPILMLLVAHTRSKLVVWLTWCAILIIFNLDVFQSQLTNWLSDIHEGEYKTAIMLAWIILRSLSFSLDVCEEDPSRREPTSSYLFNLLAYCLYFPLLVTGPYMPYDDFKIGLQKPYESWDKERLIGVILQLLRFGFWLFLSELLLYYFYAHSFQFIPSQLNHLDSWQLNGFVYFLLIFFLLKYVGYYGYPGVFAKADGFEPPRHPTCVLLVSRMSDVWRYFDFGLYRFMIKQIYIPFLNNDTTLAKQLQASTVVFTFVYVWHGISQNILYWSAFNFFAVALEKIGNVVTENREYKEWEERYLPGAWSRRFHAFLATPILLTSVVALVIFLSSLKASAIVMRKIFYDGFPAVTVTVYFAFYCICQCGMELHSWRQTRLENG